TKLLNNPKNLLTKLLNNPKNLLTRLLNNPKNLLTRLLNNPKNLLTKLLNNPKKPKILEFLNLLPLQRFSPLLNTLGCTRSSVEKI
ncbi:hypothetical protein, partial [Baaleninema sp.]|uniref:hypothetical protein n=1 Tax=Baaleninema sp. TaxID=3101197 RepID=UPI003D0229ED